MLSPERGVDDDYPLDPSTPSTYNSPSFNINKDNSGSKSKFRQFLGIGTSKDRRIDLVAAGWKLFQSAKENHSIELLMFLHMCGYTCTTVIVQNLYIDRICRLDYGFSQEICRNLTDRNMSDYEKQVEQTAALFQMYRNIVEALIPIFFALFLGPFVDRRGTKLPILLSLSGYTVASLMYCVMSLLPSVPAPYLLICSVPISLTGGLVAFLLAAFTHVSTRSTEANRSFRIALLEGSWVLGVFGFQIAAQIYKSWGFIPVFLISAFCFALALLYGIHHIHEPSFNSLKNSSFSSIFYEIFDLKSAKDTMATVFRPRAGPSRKWVILLMATIFLRMLAGFGTSQVFYLYTRNKFQWDATSFSMFSTFDTIVCLLGGLATLLMMKTFDLSDSIVGIFSSVIFILTNLVYGGAGDGRMMYFGSTIQMFSGLITIVMRSMISKCVEKDELAKAFSFVSIGEACMPILAGLLFSLLFRSTVHTFPGAVFLLSAFLHSFILCSFIYFYTSSKRDNNSFKTLVEEQAMDNTST